jgi:hypothetical protein
MAKDFDILELLDRWFWIHGDIINTGNSVGNPGDERFRSDGTEQSNRGYFVDDIT